MILQLHAGQAPDVVRPQLVRLLGRVPYDEVVEVERELIDEGLPTQGVLKLCDIHTGPGGARSTPAGTGASPPATT